MALTTSAKPSVQQIPGIDLAGLVESLGQSYAEDRAGQPKREAGAIAALKEAIAQFGPGYGAGMEAKARSAATAGAIGSGLGGTTRPAALSAGLAGEFEDMRRGRMAGALSNLGSFLGSYRDPFAVTPQTLTHAATGGFGGLMQERQLTESARQANLGRDIFGQPYGDSSTSYSPGTPSAGFLDGGGGSGGSGSYPNIFTESLGSFGGGSSGSTSFGGGTSGGSFGNGSFDSGSFGSGEQTPLNNAGAEGAAAIQDIDRTATGMGLTPQNAFKQFSIYSQWKAWCEGQGLNAGSEAEWKAVKRRIG